MKKILLILMAATSQAFCLLWQGAVMAADNHSGGSASVHPAFSALWAATLIIGGIIMMKEDDFLAYIGCICILWGGGTIFFTFFA